MNQPQQPPKREIKIVDNIPGAEYVNFMNVGFNKDEFHLNFANISGPSGRVVSKIISSPGHLKRLAGVLQKVMKQYEEKFGKIEEAELPNKEIGFKG